MKQLLTCTAPKTKVAGASAISKGHTLPTGYNIDNTEPLSMVEGISNQCICDKSCQHFKDCSYRDDLIGFNKFLKENPNAVIKMEMVRLHADIGKEKQVKVTQNIVDVRTYQNPEDIEGHEFIDTIHHKIEVYEKMVLGGKIKVPQPKKEVKVVVEGHQTEQELRDEANKLLKEVEGL